MNWLKENWFKVGLLIVLVISIAGAFYWYEWRPMQARRACSAKSQISGFGSVGREKEQENSYQECLREKGLLK